MRQIEAREGTTSRSMASSATTQEETKKTKVPKKAVKLDG